MAEKRKRLAKTESDPVAPDKGDLNRFGAVAFVENIERQGEDEDCILSLDSLRAAFAGLSAETDELPMSALPEDPDAGFDAEPNEIEYDEEPLDETLAEDLFENDASGEHDEPVFSVELSPRTILEAMLFVGDRGNKPLTPEKASEKMRNVEPEEIDRLISDLNRDYELRRCPYLIRRDGDGYRMVLHDDFDVVRARFYGKIRETRLSQQAIDVLAVVAYRQPVSAEDVQKTRRQPSSSLLNQLVKRGLLETVEGKTGKKIVPLYRTTGRFLKLFQLETIEDLPVSDDFDFR